MASELPPDETAPHNPRVLDEGIALALKAEDSHDWKAVADWLAHNPDHAVGLAEFLAAQRGLRSAVAPQRVAPTDRAGLVVGGLELKEQIGHGGVGVVYRAFDPILKRDVAVKVLKSAGLSRDEVARFRYEAEVAAGLDHPNVVPVLAFGEAGGDPYLVMPLMTGGSLAAWLKGRRPDRQLPADQAAELVCDVALGIHHAHQRGLIHRDLKPGNILLDRDGGPHIADFGLARPLGATVTGVAGTYLYMAPEQARGEKHLTTAVDVHALGVILFELLTGGLPFGGPDAMSIMRRVAEEPAPLLRQFRPDVPADLEAICLKCLEKEPSKRYTAAQGVADDLGRFLKGQAVTARQPGFWDWVRQLARTTPDINQNYTWQVLVWFGGIVLVANAAVFGLVRSEAPSAWVWVTHIASGTAMCVVLWWYMLSRFRQLPLTERHSLVIAVGHVLAFFPLVAAYVPLSFSVPAREGLAFYPALAAVSAVCLFTLGSTHWSRFFLIGCGFLSAVPLLARWPEASPLVYGTAHAAVMWYWAYAKGIVFARQARRNAASSSS